MQRSEAGVEVIEARVDQVQGANRRMPGVGDMAMSRTAGADTVGRPEDRAIVVEGDIPFPFEGCLTRRLPEQEGLALEPLVEVRGLGPALRMVEAGERGHPVLYQGAVAEEDHVGTARFGMQQANVGDTTQDVMKTLPLREGKIARGSMDVAGHPRIDDVVDAVPLRRTHQVCGAGVVRR